MILVSNADLPSRTDTVLVCVEETEHQNGQVPENTLFLGQSWDLNHNLLMMESYRIVSHLSDVV